MIWVGTNREKGKSSEKGIGWALWGRLKFIFIVPKLRLIQIIQRKKTFCSNKFCRRKIFVYNCEWKFIAVRLQGNCRRW